MKDSLGDRMKAAYEDRTRVMLPRRTFTILRVDGKAFHSYTRHCEKPHDRRIVLAMNAAALALCREVQGAHLAYVQSDEISVVMGDFSTIQTEAWFDGNLQKIVSVAASLATGAFNEAITVRATPPLAPTATFDARAFTIPDPVEVANYFIWRQQDAVRNSIQSLARAYFSHKAMDGVDMNGAQELLFREKGINWNDCPTAEKRGRCIVKDDSGWRVDEEIPTFTADRDYLMTRMPTRAD